MHRLSRVDRLGRQSLPLALIAVVVGAAVAAACASNADEVQQGELSCEVRPSETFRDRIEPLLVDDNVTTCNQCHLSGVDLAAFVRETPCKTLACLTEQGLVNLVEPSESRILGWIERASPESELITAEVIEAERNAFLDWIEANAACPGACAGVTCGKLSDGPTCGDGTADPEPELPTEMFGCSDIEVEKAFRDEVYAWRGRCFPCHFDTELMADKDAPRWLSLAGNCETGSVASLRRIVGLGLMDLAEPKKSLLLQKPLDVVAGGVMHGGGSKFSSSMDPAYVSFLQFIEYYATCSADAATEAP